MHCGSKTDLKAYAFCFRVVECEVSFGCRVVTFTCCEGRWVRVECRAHACLTRWLAAGSPRRL